MEPESSSLRQCRPRLHDGKPPSPPPTTEGEETGDWAELPRDALLIVLHKLEILDIIFGVGHVCHSWRRVTQEEPELWRRIDMLRLAKLEPHRYSQFQSLAHSIARRSAGQCESFWAIGFPDYYFTVFSHGVTLKEAIPKFPQLEELELSLHTDMFNDMYEVCAAAAEACPLLKTLRLNKQRYHCNSRVEDKEAMEIGKMHGLRSLQLFGNSLGNDGLAAILDGCPQLEYLDVRHCFSIRMDRDNMQNRCARIWTFKLPNDPMDDYNLPFRSPKRWCNVETPVRNLSFRWDVYWDSL
ncbi:hypothetical protein PR202_gb28580 [Eleusine coracana subsp. coracana]|uniref:F-box domain-containing protein n=1 Tax=Eleusine coracana subsp. coracana TaxID=191504 RepID=A0AAV5FUW3_ELECO|nr:hypothetical protein PR202_gb28580 [Eleusine coracana subsp. coracana]